MQDFNFNPPTGFNDTNIFPSKPGAQARNQIQSLLNQIKDFFNGEVKTSLAEKANKAQENWISPTLLNGFTNYPGGVPAGYRIDSLGRLHIRGKLSIGTSIASSVNMFTLPAGYRTTYVGYKLVKYVSPNGTGVISCDSGSIGVSSSVASPTYVDLGEIILSLD